MKLLICLDYSSITDKILEFTKTLAAALKTAEITVLHIVDETLFFSTTGFEIQLGEMLNSESIELKEKCMRSLGAGTKYIEEYGIPKLVADEMLEELDYDLLLVGSHGRNGIGGRLMGGFAEHVMSHSKKPVLFIRK